ncbi:MAG: substrate-binding domain-containing protein, partial [Eubacteriales bacterium]
SGTRDAVESIFGIKDKAKYAQELTESGAVITAVASTENAIGYVSLDLVTDKVKAVTLDSVKAGKDTVLAGTYLLQRPFIMATKGEKASNPAAQAFLDYTLSDEGRAVIEKVGLILQPK